MLLHTTTTTTLYAQCYSVNHLCSASRLAELGAAQIKCFYRITIAKITSALRNFKNPFVDGTLRLPDYTQCEIWFCDTAVFQLRSTGYALKMIQIIWGLT